MRNIYLTQGIGGLLTGLLLGACASTIPPKIQVAPPGNPTPDQVAANPAEFVARSVRWGGSLLSTENRENATWLTVLALPLSKDGKPTDSDDSPGRFIAIVPGFLDPKVYTDERQVTVTGTLLRTETRKVGDFPYAYPVVQAEVSYLWPVEIPRNDNDRYPFYPWYYPVPHHHDPYGHPYPH